MKIVFSEWICAIKYSKLQIFVPLSLYLYLSRLLSRKKWRKLCLTAFWLRKIALFRFISFKITHLVHLCNKITKIPQTFCQYCAHSKERYSVIRQREQKSFAERKWCGNKGQMCCVFFLWMLTLATTWQQLCLLHCCPCSRLFFLICNSKMTLTIPIKMQLYMEYRVIQLRLIRVCVYADFARSSSSIFVEVSTDVFIFTGFYMQP